MTDDTFQIMTRERAIDICQRINARAFLAMGVTERPDLPSLEGVTLRQMLEAAAIVRLANGDARLVDGRRHVYVVPDDRLVAAVYVGLTFEPSAHPIAMEPRRVAGGWQMNAVAVVDVSEQSEVEDTGVAA